MTDSRFFAPLLGALIVIASTVAVLWATRPLAPMQTTLGEPVLGTPLVALPSAPQSPAGHLYIAVLEGCGPSYAGACVRARSGPGTDYHVVMQLRRGVVLRVIGETVREGRTWYKIGFDEWIRYPERARNLYVASDLVSPFTDPGPIELSGSAPQSEKRIIVDRSSQMLYAYEGETLFMKQPVSTGLELTPTPRGTFQVFSKTPSRYMQGPIPGISTQYYDLPGVPWDLYFTKQGGAIHGAYWHDNFGRPWSHGCVNLSYDAAKKLYAWADLGTAVIVRD